MKSGYLGGPVFIGAENERKYGIHSQREVIENMDSPIKSRNDGLLKIII